EGISLEGDIIDLGLKINVIDKSGAWYSYGGERLGQGKEAVRMFLKSNPAMRDELSAKIRAHYGLQPPKPADDVQKAREKVPEKAPEKAPESAAEQPRDQFLKKPPLKGRTDAGRADKK
ncbi:MAG: DNA recombination/repair protein RecA, partial [Chitinivibrionia bacterium]|nr:DNA recombination/repair protein RecA [Chitinivibrionia bacterium]